MKIKSYSIKRLFGTFSYNFLFEEMGDVIVLTGPNGYGKTTSLRILHELTRRNWYFFYQLVFDDIVVEFDNDHILTIKSELHKSDSDSVTKDVALTESKTVSFSWATKDGLIGSFVLTESKMFLVEMQWKEKVRFMNPTRRVKIEEFLLANPSTYDSIFGKDEKYNKFCLYLQQMSVLFVSSNRLMEIESKVVEDADAIEGVAASLAGKMGLYQQAYFQQLSKSRNSMIETLLAHPKAISEADYNSQRERLLPRVQNLYDWGLVDFKDIKEFNSADAIVLTVYMSELLSTLSVYNELYDKLLVFSESLDRKQFTNKIIRPRPHKGIDVRLIDNKELNLTSLSSGEQNEIILLYKLIFETQRGSLVLIDEPEMSLHLAWLRGMLNEYKTFAKFTNSQYLIATHSAAFIGGQWNITYDLFENDMEDQHE